MDNEVSRTLAQHCGTHYHWQFATTRYHCLSSAHVWRLKCSVEATIDHSAFVAIGCKLLREHKFLYIHTYLGWVGLVLAELVWHRRQWRCVTGSCGVSWHGADTDLSRSVEPGNQAAHLHTAGVSPGSLLASRHRLLSTVCNCTITTSRNVSAYQ